MNRLIAIITAGLIGSLASAAALCQSIQNGGFDDTNNSFVPGTPGVSYAPVSQMAPHWSAGPTIPGGNTPDWDTVPGTTGAGYTANVPASSQGGHWMGMIGLDDRANGESITQQVSGALPGRRYLLSFEQIALPSRITGTAPPKLPSGALNDHGYFEVSLFGTIMRSPMMAGDGNRWVPVRMEFLATSQSTRLTITARDAALGNGFESYLGVDRVDIQLLAPPIPGRCLDLERLTPGVTYKVGKAIATTASVDIFAEKYQFANGQWYSDGELDVTRGTAAGSRTVIRANNANARIMFRAPPTSVVTRFAHLGNTINLMVNGELKTGTDLKSFHGATVKGVQISVSSIPYPGMKEVGVILLTGPIGSYAIGGEEFWFNTVCAIR